MKPFLQSLFTVFVLFFTLLFLNTSYGQPFELHTISGFLDHPTKIKVADMDGDGDKDAITASGANKIVWFEAPNWQAHTIVQNWSWAGYFDVADMDGDGDFDVISGAATRDLVAWFENPSWTRHDIDTDLNGACGVCAIDMNGDDTLDVVAAGYYSNELVWYQGPSWEKNIIDAAVCGPSSNQGPEFIYVLDIDADQDLDIILTSVHETDWSKGTIFLYNGPNWEKQVIDNTASWTGSMAFGDLDQDGDLDAVATGFSKDKIYMYELPAWTRTSIDNYINAPIGADVGDLNKDGHLDVIGSGQSTSNPLRWYKGPDWVKEYLLKTQCNVLYVCISDLDDDDDLDIIAGIGDLNDVVWFENKLPKRVPEHYPTIQSAIDAAQDGDVVLVDEGTYYENISFKGKKITVASRFYEDSDTSHISKTIIDGSKPSAPNKGSVVIFAEGEDTTSVLMGFTITGGTGTYVVFGSYQEYHGGGIYISNSGAKIVHNHIIDNHISTQTSRNACGGGISTISENGFIIIEDNLIKNNSVYSSGLSGLAGGASLGTNNKIRFTHNKVIHNKAEGGVYSAGGGLYVFGGDQTNFGLGIFNGTIEILSNCIRNNEAKGGTGTSIPNGGGGMYIDMCSPKIYNNVISGNTAPRGGGGLILYDTRSGNILGSANPEFVNNTIADNRASAYGGGIFIENAQLTLMNSILWNNVANNSQNQLYKIGTVNIMVSYSDVSGGLPPEWDNTGNINLDPKFHDYVQSEGDTLFCCLQAESPCIDAGNPDPMYNDFNGSINDMGAYGGPTPIEIVVGIDEELEKKLIPVKYYLSQNYPNPFNPITSIEYQLPKASRVNLSIYNILGQKVTTLVSEMQHAGLYQVEWNAEGLASGIYLYRLETDQGFVAARKLIVMK